jgi:hypothetical protein
MLHAFEGVATLLRTARIGAILMGARTFQPASTEEGRAYGGAVNGPQFVLTHDGVRLFSHPGGTNVVLDRIRATPSPKVTDLWFRVRR